MYGSAHNDGSLKVSLCMYILFVREGFSLVFPTHSLWIYKEILVNWLLSSLKWDRIWHIQRIVFILLTSCYECGFVIRFLLYLWEDLFPFARVKLFPYPGNSLWHLNKRNLRTIGDERVRITVCGCAGRFPWTSYVHKYASQWKAWLNDEEPAQSQ